MSENQKQAKSQHDCISLRVLTSMIDDENLAISKYQIRCYFSMLELEKGGTDKKKSISTFIYNISSLKKRNFLLEKSKTYQM